MRNRLDWKTRDLIERSIMNATFNAWVYRLLFGLTLAALLFGGLVPKPEIIENIQRPDLAFCLAAAWMLRRPDYTPVSLVILYELATEIIYYQPVGLWSALVFAALMFLRRQVDRVRQLPFWFEWLLVSGTITGTSMIYGAVLVLLFVPVSIIQEAALHMLMTVLAYPAVVIVTNWIFLLRKSTSTEAGLLEIKY